VVAKALTVSAGTSFEQMEPEKSGHGATFGKCPHHGRAVRQ